VSHERCPYRSRELALAEREAALEAELQTLLGPSSDPATRLCTGGLTAQLDEIREARAVARPDRTRVRLPVYRGAPCEHVWEALWGDDFARKCRGCGQDVYDISGLSSEGVALALRRRLRRLPKKLFRREDGTVVLRDCPQFWLRRGLSLVLALLLGFVSASIDLGLITAFVQLL
jgi:hypothetical protein